MFKSFLLAGLLAGAFALLAPASVRAGEEPGKSHGESGGSTGASPTGEHAVAAASVNSNAGAAPSVSANNPTSPNVGVSTTSASISPAAQEAGVGAPISPSVWHMSSAAETESFVGALMNAFGLSNAGRIELSDPLELHPRRKTSPSKGADMVKVQAIANKALHEGAILPLSEIMRTATDRKPGTLMSVNLSKTAAETWVYSLVILGDDGIYSEVEVDAKENRLIGVK